MLFSQFQLVHRNSERLAQIKNRGTIAFAPLKRLERLMTTKICCVVGFGALTASDTSIPLPFCEALPCMSIRAVRSDLQKKSKNSSTRWKL